MKRLLVLMMLAWAGDVEAQIQSWEYELAALPVINNAVIIGAHVSRLDWAVRNCGGRHNLERVGGFGTGRQDNPGGYVEAYNKELPRLGLHERFRGKGETCRRLYQLYGPTGVSAAGAYDPTRDLSGQPIGAVEWLKK